MSSPAKLVRLVVVVVALIYSFALYSNGLQFNDQTGRILALLPTASVVCVILWDLYALKSRSIAKFFKRPRIDGLWLLTLRPSPESQIPKGGNRGPIKAYAVIKQSFWSLHITQFTVESTSESISHSWHIPLDGGPVVLNYIYSNVPKERHAERSVRSNGSSAISFRLFTPNELEGTYFTDRYTKGDIEMSLISRRHEFNSFKECDRSVPKA